MIGSDESRNGLEILKLSIVLVFALVGVDEKNHHVVEHDIHEDEGADEEQEVDECCVEVNVDIGTACNVWRQYQDEGNCGENDADKEGHFVLQFEMQDCDLMSFESEIGFNA